MSACFHTPDVACPNCLYARQALHARGQGASTITVEAVDREARAMLDALAERVSALAKSRGDDNALVSERDVLRSRISSALFRLRLPSPDVGMAVAILEGRE